MAPGPADSYPSARPSAPTAPVPLPRPRPPEAFEPPLGKLIPMYPMPDRPPKSPKPGRPPDLFDPHSDGYPLAVPSDSGRPNFEDRYSSPWWLTNMSAPISSTNITSQPNISFLQKRLAAQNQDVNDFIDRVIYAESAGDTYSHSGPRSGVGPAQFVKDTWRGELAEHHPELITENPWLDPAMRQITGRLSDRARQHRPMLYRA